jgi:cobalt-zinc-cadmium efflux system outer membrane protein
MLRNPVLSLLFPWGPKQLEFTLNLPIEMFWQRPRRIKEAGFKADAVAEQLVGHGVKLIADVRVAYLEARAAGDALEIADDLDQEARKLVRIAESRLQAGDISELDLHLSQADAVRLETASLARRAARDVAFVRLRSLLGLPADCRPLNLVPSGDDASAECDDLPALVKAALAARPDVRAAEIGVEAAGAKIGLEKSKVLALSALLDANGKGTEGFEMGPGIAMEIPIFSQNQGGKARAEAELAQASRRYLAARSAAARDVETAYIRLTEAQATEGALTTSAGSGIAAAPAQAERAFEAGEISLLAFLEIRQRILTLDLARLDAGLATSRAVVRLEEAAGGRCRMPGGGVQQ